MPPLKEIEMQRHKIELTFIDGKTSDLEIAGYGFIGFHLSIPNVKRTTRTLTLYLPKAIDFRLRDSILANSNIFNNRSALRKDFMLERVRRVAK